MYSGKAIEGRYFIAVCDLKTRSPFVGREIRLKENGDNWRDELSSAMNEMVFHWNKDHPDRTLDLQNESVSHVHYAMKHRSREKGFILTHSFDKCSKTAARSFTREAVDRGYLPPKEKRGGYGSRRP